MTKITLDTQLDMFYGSQLPDFCIKPLAEKLNAEILRLETNAEKLRSIGNHNGAQHYQEKALNLKLDLIGVLNQ